MKQLYIMMLAAGVTLPAAAQEAAKKSHGDSLLSRVVLDVNFIGGFANQAYKTAGSSANYTNALNVNTGNLTFKNGFAYGADLQLGVFFGKKKHVGIGTGVLYLMEQGDALLDNYHIEFQSTDFQGRAFRQVVTGNDVRENLKITNLNIPLMLKYKNRFSTRWGFAAEAGALFNVQTKTNYTTNATFDYEAIYQFAKTDAGTTTSVYDNAPVPSVNDWMITKAEFQRNNPGGSMKDYFNAKQTMGYSVGLNQPAAKTKGTVTNTKSSVGLLLRPSFNYFLSDNVALNLGAYYLYQPFKNTPTSSYRLTDGVGNYSSVTNNVTASNNQSYGLNIGARFFFGKERDRDHDGIPDKADKCPDVAGIAKFLGCPDTDGDGIQDSEDSCRLVPGDVRFHGCPDSDGDGIPDNEDSCVYVKGIARFHGCPDTDADGIMDREDSCVTVYGLAEYNGCPDTDGDGVIDKKDKCPTVAGPASNQGCPLEKVKDVVVPQHREGNDISAPILFDVNKTTVHSSSMSLIDNAAEELKENKRSTLTIDGHADASGSVAGNDRLSLERANAVKSQLTKRGINPNRMKTKGHGSRVPAATNATYDGKQQNRRAEMKLLPGK